MRSRSRPMAGAPRRLAGALQPSLQQYAAAAFARPPPVGEPMLLAAEPVNDMLRNWAIHARKIGMLYTVACMTRSSSTPPPSRPFPLSSCATRQRRCRRRCQGALKYYRMDPKAFMQMGILKVP